MKKMPGYLHSWRVIDVKCLRSLWGPRVLFFSPYLRVLATVPFTRHAASVAFSNWDSCSKMFQEIQEYQQWAIVDIAVASSCNVALPICSMYGIFTNICPKNHPNVGIYTIHGAYGLLCRHNFTGHTNPLQSRHGHETSCNWCLNHIWPTSQVSHQLIEELMVLASDVPNLDGSRYPDVGLDVVLARFSNL